MESSKEQPNLRKGPDHSRLDTVVSDPHMRRHYWKTPSHQETLLEDNIVPEEIPVLQSLKEYSSVNVTIMTFIVKYALSSIMIVNVI